MKPINCAIIGGSGMYQLQNFKVVDHIKPETPYGSTSDEIVIYSSNKKVFAFLPRHGSNHTIPPHKVPYKANLYALYKLGVRHIYSTCIAGSLKRTIHPGTFVVLDQLIDFTSGRDDYFNVDKKFNHIAFAYPFCSVLCANVVKACRINKLSFKNKGTAVIIQGPRFATLAESLWYIKNGWDVINMTQYPEAYFAREFGLCYSSIAMITDYNPGVLNRLQMNRNNLEKIKTIINTNISNCHNVLRYLIDADTRHECQECYYESYLDKL